MCLFIRLLLGPPTNVFNNIVAQVTEAQCHHLVRTTSPRGSCHPSLPIDTHHYHQCCHSGIWSSTTLKLCLGSTSKVPSDWPNLCNVTPSWLNQGVRKERSIFSGFPTVKWQDEESLRNGSSVDPIHSTEDSLEESQILGKEQWKVGRSNTLLLRACMYSNCDSVDWPLGCLQNFTVKNNAEKNIYVCAFLLICPNISRWVPIKNYGYIYSKTVKCTFFSSTYP